MQQTLNAVLMLADELFGKYDDVFFLMTRTLNQDKLENLFSILRQKGGNNINPSVSEINTILARLMTAKIVQLSSSTNCEEITDSSLEIISNLMNEQRLEEIGNSDEDVGIDAETTSLEIDEIINKSAVEVVDSFENCDQISADILSLRYYVGYVAFKMLRKFNCSNCENELKKEEVLSQPSELFIFHKNYSSFSDFGSLVAPSDEFMNVSKVFVQIFHNIFSNQPHQIGLRKYIIEKCEQACPDWFSSCLLHKQEILNFMILVLIRKHCHWASPDNNQKKKRKLQILKSK